MKAILSLLLLVSFGGARPGRAADKWDKYVPEKERKAIMKPLVKSAGLGGIKLIGGMSVIATWQTEPDARAIVSNYIDKDRLTADEAEAKYKRNHTAGFVRV
jgi:hypothetical protein